MRKLISIGVVVAAVCALPSVATADNFTVDTLTDVHIPTVSCTEAVAADCSLRDAILHADATESIDEIDFAVAGTIEIMEREVLPDITEPVRINGGTAPGYVEAPVVTLDGAKLKGTTEGAPETGLRVESEGVEVSDLSMVDFETAVVVGEGNVGLCGDYLGTDASGTAAKPNRIGVRIAAGAESSTIGAGCEQNVISNNREYGILDEGVETGIRNNLIGTTPDGSGALPNGSEGGPGAGVFVGTSALDSFIGGGGEAGPPNTIAHNHGPGVFVAPNAKSVTIFGNAIFDNGGPGIVREAPTKAPAAPILTSLEGSVLKGTVTGQNGGGVVLQFFAGRACDASGAGEGETWLELEKLVATGSGPVPFEVTLPEREAGEPVITATSTSFGPVSETSQFSNCLPPPPPPPPEPPSFVPPLIGTVPPPPPPTPGPMNGRTFLIEPVSGTVLVKKPGETSFHELVAGELIPVGSTVDATRGKVRLTSVDASGKVQSAVFYGGVFRVDQKAGGTLVVLKLIGSIGPCPKAVTSAAASKGGGRQLWGSGKGNFRTEGKYGAATVRGTIWLTADRCSGTFFKVKRGVVAIRDFAGRRGVTLRAGDTYLASPG